MKFNYLILSFVFITGCYSQTKNSLDRPSEWIFDLARKSNLELVYGDKFPFENPFDSYGSPFISGTLNTGRNVYNKKIGITMTESFNYVLFYGRKMINESLDKNDYFSYEYFLIFAKTKPLDYGGDYQVDSVFPAPGGLLGMHLHYGELKIDLSEFHYLGNPNKKGSKNIMASEANIPVILPSENGTVVMVFYKSEWMIHFDRDW